MKFGKLTVLEKAYQKKDTRWMYKCLCECGNIVYRPMNSLKSKGLKGCGCTVGKNITHGMKYSRVYRIWSGMKNRCTNPNDKDFEKYSALGICDYWLKFENFLHDMGEPPSDSLSIDRIDNTKGYFKENCRWATKSEQQKNKSTSCIWIANGVEYPTLNHVADAFGVSAQAAWRWFRGYKDRGRAVPPKEGFIAKRIYD